MKLNLLTLTMLACSLSAFGMHCNRYEAHKAEMYRLAIEQAEKARTENAAHSNTRSTSPATYQQRNIGDHQAFKQWQQQIHMAGR